MNRSERPFIFNHMEISLDGKIMGKYLWIPETNTESDPFYRTIFGPDAKFKAAPPLKIIRPDMQCRKWMRMLRRFQKVTTWRQGHPVAVFSLFWTVRGVWHGQRIPPISERKRHILWKSCPIGHPMHIVITFAARESVISYVETTMWTWKNSAGRQSPCFMWTA